MDDEIELLRYERLAEDLSGIIAAGNLRPGERLPSVRRLSRERRLSVSTVLQALRQLEDRGLVEARPQSGYFVRHASARRAQPSVRSTPEEAVPVDVSQRLMRVLQTGVSPGVSPSAPHCLRQRCCRLLLFSACTVVLPGAIRSCSRVAAT